MSEHSEHPSQRPPESPPGGSPPEVIGTAPPAGGPPTPSRFRRWSANATVRTGAVALAAGLAGGLAGGGIVAAFSDDDGHDHARPVRFEREAPRGFPGFRGPRYRVPRGPENAPPYRRPAQPAPTPSPRTTG